MKRSFGTTDSTSASSSSAFLPPPHPSLPTRPSFVDPDSNRRTKIPRRDNGTIAAPLRTASPPPSAPRPLSRPVEQRQQQQRAPSPIQADPPRAALPPTPPPSIPSSSVSLPPPQTPIPPPTPSSLSLVDRMNVRARGRGSRRGGSSQQSRAVHNSKSSRAKVANPQPPLEQAEGPIHNREYILATYSGGVPLLRGTWLDNPKSPVMNFMSVSLGKEGSWEHSQVMVNGTRVQRCRVVADEEYNIIGIGDATNKKEAEKLAALSALLQLSLDRRLPGMAKAPLPPKTTDSGKASAAAGTPKEQPNQISDGTAITYERARQFMDYYCHRFKFGKPDITFEQVPMPFGRKGNSGMWEAIMTVGGRRIGMGTGPTKKQAQTQCYVDVTLYLEECDRQLWTDFVAKFPKEHTAVGMAPAVVFRMSDVLDDQIRDLCRSIRAFNLYANRPKIGSGKTGEDTPPSGPQEDANAWMVAEKAEPVVESKLQSGPPAVSRGGDVKTERFFNAKSQRLKDALQAYNSNPQLAFIRNQRRALPVYTRAEEVLAQVDANDVTVVMAATGSGKTTQIPQLILDDWTAKGMGSKCNVICTQPRRIAAISVAERVAKERGEQVGQSIGYQVRFESKRPFHHGCVTFCTTGVFLKRMQSALQEGSRTKDSMDDITHVVVDEVHERDVDTDLVLVVLKRLLADRKARGVPLKVVLMSATIDPTLFQQYFRDERGLPAPISEIPGRSFPVERKFLDEILPEIWGSGLSSARGGWVFDEKNVREYIEKEVGWSPYPNRAGPIRPPEVVKGEELEIPYGLVALITAHVLASSEDGHVLVFLPGWEEINQVRKMLVDSSRYPLLDFDFADPSKFSVHVLHSTIPVQEQQAVFEPPTDGVRRIILSTNIAETSVTIPDVVYVVDAARVKEKRYDPERHMSSLVSAWVGKSNLNQRAGRAGRHRPGNYYGVLSKRRMELLDPYQLVEMKRVDLSDVVMHVKALNFPDMEVEEVLAATIEPPSDQRVAAAIDNLKHVGALDADKNLTSLGRLLLQIPTEAQIGRLCLFGSFFRCLDPALTIAAVITNRDPFVSPPTAKQEANAAKESWAPKAFRSDLLATLRAYNEWWKMQSRGDYAAANHFCNDNYLSKASLLQIQKVKSHILAALHRAGVLDVSAKGVDSMVLGRNPTVPPSLNENAESLPVLAAMIAIASQPNFAIKTGPKTLRTDQDSVTFIHPSSVNAPARHKAHDKEEAGMYTQEKDLYAFSEKLRNVSGPGGEKNAQTFLRTSTKLDPLTYLLFGAYHLRVTERGLECDDWLPIIGDVDGLDDIERLKTLMESCLLRVFEGVNKALHQVRVSNRNALPTGPRAERIDDDFDDGRDSVDDDPEETKGGPLSAKEIDELDHLTQSIAGILDQYSEEHGGQRSRYNSRPSTPSGGPFYPPSGRSSSMRLNVPSRFGSGTNTPLKLSRPSSPLPPPPSNVRRV